MTEKNETLSLDWKAKTASVLSKIWKSLKGWKTFIIQTVSGGVVVATWILPDLVTLLLGMDIGAAFDPKVASMIVLGLNILALALRKWETNKEEMFGDGPDSNDS